LTGAGATALSREAFALITFTFHTVPPARMPEAKRMTRPFDGAISCLCEAAAPPAVRDAGGHAAKGGVPSPRTPCTRLMRRKACENARHGLHFRPSRRQSRATAAGAQELALPRPFRSERTPEPLAAIRHPMNRQDRDGTALGVTDGNVGRGPETRDA
jgi:hypothetical protein